MHLGRRRRLEPEEVVITAVAVAIGSGLHAVSAAAVAARLDVPTSTVSKAHPEDLAAAAFSRIVGTELEEARQDALSSDSPVEQLATLLNRLAEPVPDLDAVWLESWSLGRHNPALGALVRSAEGAWHDLVAAVVERGVRAGVFLEADPEQVAVHLLAVVDGVNAYSLVGYRSQIDRMRLLHAVVRAHLGVTLPGGAPVEGDPVT
jgi:AcrR family transcriptional regulator